jgi:hypothetical protein
MIFPSAFHLTQEEARRLAAAMLNAEAEWGVAMSGKWQAALVLLAVAGGTYRPKLQAFGEQVRQRKQAARAAANPTHFEGPPNQPWAGGAPAPPAEPAAEVIFPHGRPDAGEIKYQ